MNQIDNQKILADLKRFDTEISHRKVESVAGAALGFVGQHLQLPYASLVLCEPDKKRLRVLTLSGGKIVPSEPFPAGDQPNVVATAMETGAAVYCRDVAG